MLLKRSLALAIGLLLFIGGFFVYFEIKDAQREASFRQERQKYGIEGAIPLAANLSSETANQPDVAPTPTPIPETAPAPAPAPAPIPSPAPGAMDNPAPPPTLPPAPTTDAPLDTNIIIGPMPPANTPTPADTNAAPAAPTPSSTMLRAPVHPLALLLFTATENSPTNAVPTNSVLEPVTNGKPVTPLLPLTNEELPPASTIQSATPTPLSPSTNSDTPKAVPVEASVIVLGYHQFVGAGESSKNPYVMKADVFDQEMKYLKDNGYHVIPLSDVVRFVKHEIGLPPNSVAITIDDGYKSAIVHAAPILKKYGYPWTYFVYPEFITVTEGKGAASWADLAALQADGVDIESHSMTHPTLTSHTQKFKGSRHTLSAEEYDEFLTNETTGSKELIEKKLGKPVSYFAYPYGAYNKQVEAKAIAAGYDGIFTVADNPVHSSTNKNSIGRYVITQPVERMFATYLRQGALGLANADPAPGGTTTQPRPVISAVLSYEGTLDPKSIETSVRDFGMVHHDFDPKTSTVRLYLPRDLIQPVNIVNIRVKDAETGQVMVANWHFNYEPTGAAAATNHPPIVETAPTNAAPSAATNAEPAHATNGPAAAKTQEEPAPAAKEEPAPAHSSSSKNP